MGESKEGRSIILMEPPAGFQPATQGLQTVALGNRDRWLSGEEVHTEVHFPSAFWAVVFACFLVAVVRK
jgi:hypothetical protein